MLSIKTCSIIVSIALIAGIPAAQAKEQELPPINEDGLHLVPDTKMAIVYADPEADLGPYNRVMLMEAYVAFKKNWERDQRSRSASSFPVRSKDMEKMKSTMASEAARARAGADPSTAMPVLAGSQGAGAGGVADAVFGQVNPSGKLAETFPVRLEDTPAFLNFPAEEGEVLYGERIFVGYRYYDERGIAPLFPFGHGLSYTSFEYSDLELSPGEAGVEVRLRVTNTGDMAGAEVVQVPWWRGEYPLAEVLAGASGGTRNFSSSGQP